MQSMFWDSTSGPSCQLALALAAAGAAVDAISAMSAVSKKRHPTLPL
jgi:hypothetical protein